MRLVMCICSARRRDLLRSCIASFQDLVVPDNWDVQLLVVDNNAVPECQAALADLVSELPLSARVVHEPDPGIPQARNRAIETALEYEPNFLAFIDDDEIIDRNWLEAMVKAHEKYNGEVYTGPVYPLNSSDSSVWTRKRRLRRRERATGLRRRVAATNNVMFSSGLVTREGRNLRFDERLRYCGGEDTDFFTRAYLQGVEIIWVSEAQVHEHVPPHRQTFSYQVRRSFREGCNKAECLPSFRSHHSKAVFLMAKGTFGVLKGTIYLVVIPYYLLFQTSGTPRQLLRAVRRISGGVGHIAGFLGYRVQPYRNPTRS